MANVVYIVRSGTLSTVTKQFNLSPYYYSSLKKAQNVRDRILSDNRAKNKEIPFDPEKSYKALVEVIDYDGEEGKYRGRIMIEKETVW